MACVIFDHTEPFQMLLHLLEALPVLDFLANIFSISETQLTSFL